MARIEVTKARRSEGKTFTKKLGTHPIHFQGELFIDFPKGIEFTLPQTSLTERILTLLRPVRTKDQLIDLIERADGVTALGIEAQVTFPRRASGIVNTQIGRNFLAHAVIHKFADTAAAHHEPLQVRVTANERNIGLKVADREMLHVRQVTVRNRKVQFHPGSMARNTVTL